MVDVREVVIIVMNISFKCGKMYVFHAFKKWIQLIGVEYLFVSNHRLSNFFIVKIINSVQIKAMPLRNTSIVVILL